MISCDVLRGLVVTARARNGPGGSEVTQVWPPRRASVPAGLAVPKCPVCPGSPQTEHLLNRRQALSVLFSQLSSAFETVSK